MPCRRFVKMIRKRALILISVLLLQGCFSDSDADYDYGYGDGYGAGYNTTCKIRATMIKGDWDNKDYSRGYREGYTDGSYACRNKK
jgi:hypothetical protein